MPFIAVIKFKINLIDLLQNKTIIGKKFPLLPLASCLTSWGWTVFGTLMLETSLIGMAAADSSLYLAYPSNHHQTTSERIFLVGTAPIEGEVTINGQSIQRSKSGHFAPSFLLQIGNNPFTIRYQNQELQINISRLVSTPSILQGVAFADNSLTPSTAIARLPGERICFSAIAPPQASVSVQLNQQTIPLYPQSKTVQLPPNSAILTASNRPITTKSEEALPLQGRVSLTSIGQYEGCAVFEQAADLETPIFQLNLHGQTISQTSSGSIEILSPERLEVIEVIAENGVTRTGPSSDYSRLTPLPKGTTAAVTGKEGDWLRLDYGAWIEQKETRLLPTFIPPQSLIRSINSRQTEGATEIIFPLQVPVPISVIQGNDFIKLTLYNTTAQTDTIRLVDNPLIKNFTWQQVTPTQIDYTFYLKTAQQWGYDLKYEGTNLVFSLRHPSNLIQQNRSSLKGIKILIDPGHGGQELGAKGPNGYPEKDINLTVSELLKQELIKRGATVYTTRDTDIDVSLTERVEMINKLKPTIALSIHYNALPDNGDAINTAGVGAFWYHLQANNLAQFLHDYLVQKLNRPSYGVFWNNLALTRPHTTPSILLELGFMINPTEFEWVSNSEEQKKLAKTLADGITEWFSPVK